VDPFLQFLQQVREVVEGHEGHADRTVCRVAELLDTLINESRPGFSGSAEPGRRYGELLYEDPRTGFVVVLMAWGPHSETRVHEHDTWDVFGVLTGKVFVRNYIRESEGEPCLVAEFEARPGDVTYLIPPDQAIHKLANETDAPALTLHVYERHLDRVYGNEPEQ